jgi:thiamine-phosphate pyrophosphorylase
MLLYYITGRRQLAGTAEQQRVRLLSLLAQAAQAGVDLLQLREKDLAAGELECLAREAMAAVGASPATRQATRLLVNSRTDVALAAGCDGVQLTSADVGASAARQIFSGAQRPCVIGMSCHSVAEVSRAAEEGADFAVLGPIFEKNTVPGIAPLGLAKFAEACRKAAEVRRARPMPVLALGGVTLENAQACLDAGAAGIAAIRLFQEHDLATIVAQLRQQA